MSMLCPECAAKTNCTNSRQVHFHKLQYVRRRYQCKGGAAHRFTTTEVIIDPILVAQVLSLLEAFKRRTQK